MKKIGLLILALALVNFLANYSVAANITLDDCEREGSAYNDGSVSNVEIRKECSDLIKRASAIRARDITPANDLIAFGHRNIIYYKKFSGGVWREEKIAGMNTLLHSVDSIKIDEKNQSLVVVANNNSAIFTFIIKDMMAGNIIPDYQNMSSLTEGVSSAVVDEKRDQIAAVYTTAQKVLFFNREACKFGRIEKKKLGQKREISGTKTLLRAPVDVAIDSSRRELYILDSDRILVFAADAHGDVSPKRIISELEVVGAQKIRFDGLRKKFVVFGSDGAKREIEL